MNLTHLYINNAKKMKIILIYYKKNDKSTIGD